MSTTTMCAADLGPLLQQHRHGVLCLAWRMLENREDAEDVAQETMLKAFQHWGNFRGDSSVRTWLNRIATNLSLGVLRQGRQRAALAPTVPLDGVVGEVPCREGGPESLLLTSEVGRAAVAAARGLGPVLESAFRLRYVLGLHEAEVAEVLGLTLPAAKTRIRRSRLGVRDAMRKEFGKGKEKT